MKTEMIVEKDLNISDTRLKQRNKNYKYGTEKSKHICFCRAHYDIIIINFKCLYKKKR